jgi:hypothetical protein
VKTQPLTPAEQARIDDAISAFVQMVHDAGLADEDGGGEADTPELAEELLHRWAAEPPKGRLPVDVIATIIGAGLGEYLRQHLRLTWAAAVEKGERSLGLASEIDGEAVLSPFDEVKRCIEEENESFVQHLFEDLPLEYPHLLRPEA